MKRAILLMLVLVLMFTVVLAGCSNKTATPSIDTATKTEAPKSTATETPKETPKEAVKVEYKDAPMFAGKGLPPVTERLPKEPKITNEISVKDLKDGKLEIGQYGGVLRMTNNGPDWNPDIFLMANEALLNTPSATGEEVTPNIVKKFEMSPDSKEFTFYMREGLKWSDGNPVTTEDVRFAIEDVLMNKELTPAGIPPWLRAGNKVDGEPMKFQVVDQFTFKISFTEPYGRFPIQLALTGWRGYTDLLKPKHFLQQFHVKYTPLDKLEPAIKEAKFKPGEWVNLFNFKDVTNWSLTYRKAIGFPVLYPYIMKAASDTSMELERNPYYYKVDAAGNQLPYIDTLKSDLVADVEIMTQKVIAGEVDFMRESAALNKMQLYKDNEARGGYSAIPLNMHVNPTCMFINQTFKDPNWRKVVQDVRFRQALNMAINRKEIIDAVYFGMGELPKLVPSEFNKEQAMKLLDEMGMKKGADGFRVGPDGKVFEVPILSAKIAPDMVPVNELVLQMWTDIGLKVTMKTVDPTLWGQRIAANEAQVVDIWNVEPMWRSGGWTDFITDNNQAPLWAIWNTSKGTKGEEPPAAVKRLMELGQLINTVYPGTPEDLKYYDEMYKIHYDNVYQMPIAEKVKQPLIINSKIGNVPVGGTAVAVDIGGEQLYYKK